jgi:zinc protease
MKNLYRWTLLFVFALTLIPAQASAIPLIQEARLDNGLRILLTEAHNVPMVAMQLSMAAGSRYDPQGHGGTASLLAAMLGDHTNRHDYKAWGSLLDAKAIKLGADADKDKLNVSLMVLKEALPAGLDAMSEMLLAPGWDKKRFATLKEDSIAAARKAEEEPRTRASEAVVRLLYKGHPYGHLTDGSVDSLPKIHLSDLKGLYKAQCKPEGAVLAVSGDITMQELLPLLKKRFGSWHGTPKQGKPLAAAKPVAGKTVRVNMPTSQTLVQFVRQGIDRHDPDFFPLFVMNHVLGGGGFGSVLMQEVREKRGLVYGVYSYFVPLQAPGPFSIVLQTRADQADKAAALVRKIMARMAKGDINAKQLKASKDNLIGSFAQRMDSNRERVGLIGMIGFYNLPLDYLQVWTSKVQSVTLADVRKAAVDYLNPDQWNLVQAGPTGRGDNHQ